MRKQEARKPEGGVSRRDFLQSVAAGGAGLMLSQAAFATTAPGERAAPGQPAGHARQEGPADALNVAIIGVGQEGQELINAMLFKPAPIREVRIRAVCDIWPYNRERMSRTLKAYGHPNNAYEDYRELLAQEKGLDAAIVATPDWMHAEQTIACLEAGLHVYCEKEMSNSLELARQMVLAARRTGRLLQIGHQRRSNPRYQFAINEVVRGRAVLGRVAQANGQWNRSKEASRDLTCKPDIEIAPEVLARYGYDTMRHFLNWRWFRKYGGGPIVDLGSHQIDIFSWVFRNNPRAVVASGGMDYFIGREWFDTVMCLYEYDTPAGPARAFYQVLTTTGNGGYFETFMGDEGTMVLSEKAARTKVLREPNGPPWDKWHNASVLKKKGGLAAAGDEAGAAKGVIDSRESPPPEEWLLPIELALPYHQPHLRNFFDAIRHGTPLNCPAEVGYETAVAVLAVNRAIETGTRVEFKEGDFKVA